MLSDYDRNEVTIFGGFFDVTSLYAGIMQKLMPRCNYTWNSKTTLQEILETPEDSSLVFFC